MSSRQFLASAITVVLLAASAATQAQQPPSTDKKIYCWNEGGSKVCGDALPASAVNSARTEVSLKSGMTTGRVNRALNSEERHAAALAEAQAQRLADAEAMRQRRDMAMVESYSTETDLRRAFGERTELLDQTIKASRLGLSNLRLSLLTLLRQAGDLELAAQPVPKPLTASIRDQHVQLRQQQEILTVHELNRAELDTALNDALSRYRALKASSEGAGQAGAADTAAAPTGGVAR